MRAIRMVLGVGLAVFGLSTATEAGIDLVNVSVGSWIHIPVDGGFSQEIWFNKLSTQLYATVGKVKLHAAVPLAWTAETDGNSIRKKQVMFGDLSFYVGRRFGPVEPRLGAKIPLGYSTDLEQKAWIGPGSVRLRAGLGMNSSVRETQLFTVSGEVMAGVYLPGGLVLPGSWDVQPSAKLSLRARDRLKFSLEVLGSYAYTKWGEEYLEHSFFVVPNLYGEVQVKSLAFGAKLGFGPSFKSSPETGDKLVHSSYALNAAVSLNIYP